MMQGKMKPGLRILVLGTGLFGGGVVIAGEQATAGVNTGYVQSKEEQKGSRIDFRNARPMPLPMARFRPTFAPTASERPRKPGFVPGSRGPSEGIPASSVLADSVEGAGSGATRPSPAPARGGIVPHEFGSASDHPYTTSRVDLSGNTPSKLYPYRAAGKLYFNDGVNTFVCSGSLIRKGLIVTAAHCVAEFGTNSFYSGWQYIPAQSGKKKPYGTWSVITAWVMNSYLDGTANCSDPPVVCDNDIAVLVVKPKGKNYPGKMTGWFGYGWDGFGFTETDVVLVNQLGYPTSHDGGLMMQRTDSQGFLSAVDSGNTVWGSRQTGGSSGGPELINLGAPAVLSEGVLTGVDADGNTVIGVTSWGYTDDVTKEQGASPFTSGNILTLIDSACAAAPTACAP